jgi:UDP-N-acetylmuramyl tripeptide synthase
MPYLGDVDTRLAAATLAGRAAARGSRLLRKGGGTALPGLVAERVDPRVVAKLAARFGGGAVLVTGTNGKTTASRILANMLEAAGRPFLHNREGSNMMRGIASSLIGSRGGARAVLLLEVDEATMPAATAAVRPRAIAFTNLFRDQLDRYGEVDSVAALWREALAAAPPDATLVLNADDPSVAELALDWGGPVHWFGLDDASFATEAAGAFDARWCRRCGTTFAYERRYFAHVGAWRCEGCPRTRPEPGTAAREVSLRLDEARFSVPGLGPVAMPLSGTYNVYNALAAIALARVLGLPDEAIIGGLAGVRAAFGRQEVVDLDGRELRLLLTKNPAGANEVIRLLEAVAGEEPGGLKVAVLLNDRFADGQDVSWTWDVDYERLSGAVARCWAGGTRAADMALRLKYAGWPEPLAVADNPVTLIDALLRGTRPGDRVFAIHTYTAMLDLRAELARRGAVAPFWK